MAERYPRNQKQYDERTRRTGSDERYPRREDQQHPQRFGGREEHRSGGGSGGGGRNYNREGGERFSGRDRDFGESLRHYAHEQEASMHDRDHWGDADLYGGPVWDQEHYQGSYERNQSRPSGGGQSGWQGRSGPRYGQSDPSGWGQSGHTPGYGQGSYGQGSPRPGSYYGHGGAGQGSYGQGSSGQGSYGQSSYGQGSSGESGRDYRGGSGGQRYMGASSAAGSRGDWPRSSSERWNEHHWNEGGRYDENVGSWPESMTAGGYVPSRDFRQRSSTGGRGENWESGSAPRSQSFYGHGPKGYTRSDERIREDVCDRLSDDDELDASGITVTVRNGEVTLEGEVPDRASKHRAEDIADSVSGVTDVNNQIKARRGLLKEIGDKLSGRDEHQHGHAGSGTRTTPAHSGATGVSSTGTSGTTTTSTAGNSTVTNSPNTSSNNIRNGL